ncbi:UNVERIFIED_CONTAM: hypothetical protein FKN15_064879 [Acipenser sinensis]
MKKAGNATSSHVWLGLRKSCTFGFWYWVDGAKHGYDQWAPGCPCQSEPNHCGAMDRMNGYNWTAQSCSEGFNFICYKVSGLAIMEKLVILMLLLAGICAVPSGHFRKYHFVKDEKSWFDAQSYCREKHTDLATIESQEETEKVLNISAGFTDAWIGLYYDKENWQWSNGDNVSYYNWASSLNCTSVNSDGEWVDSDCNKTTYSFICYNETRESYILIDHPKTWYEAQQYCRENYTDLVSIKNNDEDKKIKEEAKGSAVWIGLFNNPWKWSHKGEYSSFHNWNKGEPNNVGNNICVEMYGTDKKERVKWNDAGCNYTLPFFCYKESCKDTSCTKYHFEKTAMNWSAAQTHCRDKYTDLATVHSQEEVKQLDHFNISTNAWIGMYRDVSENWQWSNGDEVTYNTRRGKLFCVTVNPDRDWTDSVCHDKKHFMCYNSSKESNERYILIEQPKTWYEAQQYCREHHTDLVSVKNEDENKKIKEKANGNPVWIGLFNNPWKWSDGGVNYTLQNWSEKQPDNYEGKDKCVLIQNKSNKLTLNDDPCSKAYPFFCYDDGKKLFLVNENKTWEEAVEYCRSNHTDLVSIESEEELQRVYREVNKSSSSHVWIGLLQSCTFGFWYWVDGAQSCYDNWAPEPRCQSGCNQCGVMTARNGSEWTEKPCTERFNFICYNVNYPPPSHTWCQKEYCRSNYTDLVSIGSKQELQRVYREANKASSSHVWLGLLQSCTFGFWYWVDGAQSCYDNWAPEPRCQSGCNQCGVMTARNGSEWTEKPCTERFNFICYNGK